MLSGLARPQWVSHPQPQSVSSALLYTFTQVSGLKFQPCLLEIRFMYNSLLTANKLWRKCNAAQKKIMRNCCKLTNLVSRKNLETEHISKMFSDIVFHLFPAKIISGSCNTTFIQHNMSSTSGLTCKMGFSIAFHKNNGHTIHFAGIWS